MAGLGGPIGLSRVPSPRDLPAPVVSGQAPPQWLRALPGGGQVGCTAPLLTPPRRALKGWEPFVGEQLAAGLYVGLWGKSWPASHSLSKAGIISGPAGHPLKDIPSQRGGGQSLCRGPVHQALAPTTPWTGRIPGGNPDARSLPQPSSCQAQGCLPHEMGFQGPPTLPLRALPRIVQVPGLQGLVSRKTVQQAVPTLGLTQGRPRVEVREPEWGEWGTLIRLRHAD